jgi:hypothetical protein
MLLIRSQKGHDRLKVNSFARRARHTLRAEDPRVPVCGGAARSGARTRDAGRRLRRPLMD